MDIKREFGARVRELRKRTGQTQEQLAKRCGRGFVMQRIGEVERGEANCTLDTVEKLARGMSCEPAELFLFRPKALGKRLGLLDERLADLWNGATKEQREKAVRILNELF